MVFDLWQTFRASTANLLCTVKSCLKGYFAMHSTFAISSVSKEISVIILAAEEDIPHEIKDSLINVWVGIVGNHLVGPYVLLPPDYVQNGAQEICENKRAFTHNYSNFNLLFKPLLFSE
jgi:hypothetical protein